MNKASNRTPHAVETKPEGANTCAATPSMPDVPPYLCGVFRRAENGESRKAGMDAYCWQCVGFEQEEIRRCSAPECALWEFRPVKPKAKLTEKERQWIHGRREAELARIAELNKRYVPIFRRAYKGRSRVDAVKAFAAYCMNFNREPCGTGMCPLAAYCPGVK